LARELLPSQSTVSGLWRHSTPANIQQQHPAARTVYDIKAE